MNRNPYALEARRTPQQVVLDKRHAKRNRAQRKRDFEDGEEQRGDDG